MIPGISDAEERDLILSVGTHKRDRRLSPTEVAQVFQRAIDAGATRMQLAAACQLEDGTWVGRFLRLNDLPDQDRHLVEWGSNRSSLSMTQAQEIARLGSEGDMHAMVMEALEHGFSSKELRDLVQVVRRSGSSVSSAVEAQLKLRPRIHRQYVFVGLVSDSATVSRLKEMTQAERDDLFATFTSTHGPSRLHGKLGAERFILISESRDVDIDETEAALNSWLVDRIGK